MKPGALLLAFKAIGLAEELRASDRRVACVLLDHFNRRTLQCDPSLDAIAFLAGIHRRSVIRSVDRLVLLKFFERVRHGGHFHRNFYKPCWRRFEESEAKWKARRATWSARRRIEASPCQGQESHLDGDVPSTQTFLINQSSETYRSGGGKQISPEIAGLESRKRKPSEEESTAPLLKRFHVKSAASNAAWNAAERRWMLSLQASYISDPNLYSLVIEAINPEMSEAATSAELKLHGAGIALINRELKSLSLKDA
jgi:hypothetical protein